MTEGIDMTEGIGMTERLDMTELPGIPEEVPCEYKKQLKAFQIQIKILLQNQQILLARLEKNPEDKKVLQQIEQVKIYLISFSEQQEEILDKVRNFLQEIEHAKSQEPIVKDTGKTAAVGRTPKLKGRKNNSNKAKSKSKSLKNSNEVSHVTSESSDDEDDVFLAYLDNTEGYRGHIENYDIGPDDSDNCDNSVEEFYRRIDTTETLETIEKVKFLDTIDLLTGPSYSSTVARIEELRNMKQHCLVTYVPDIADKKYRYQTFLQSTINSPPHLRTRKPNQLPSGLPTSRSSPRNIQPLEKMETRNKAINLFKSQVDGCEDLEIELSSDADNFNPSNQDFSLEERIQFRNQLLKRKLEMEDEMHQLSKRAKYLQEKKERQKEEKMLLLKQQRETEEKIYMILQNLADAASTS